MALIGSIVNYGSLQGAFNNYGNSLTGTVTSAEMMGGQVVGMRGLKGDKGDQGDQGIPGQDGADGAPGADGFSPSASVSKVGDTATITITDKDGTTTASISDGDINVQSDWNEADNTADDYIKNKPTIPSATSTTPKMDGTAAVGSETTWAKGDHVHPTDTSRAASSHTHTKSDVTDFSHTHTKSDVTDFSHTHTKSEITDFPSLATVATSGSYTDLSSKPDIHNVPSGGTSGQVLSKGSNDDYDLAWTTVTSGGGGEIVYCTCTDSASTVAKTATIVKGSLDSLETGSQVAVKFTYTNTATDPTLNVNSTGAKAIMRGGTAHVGTNTNESWGAGTVVYMLYDGSTWNIVGWLNTTYTGGTEYEIVAGTVALNKVWSPQQIHNGINSMATATPTASKNSKFDSSAHMNSTDMTTGSGGEVEDFLDGLNVHGGSLGDFVVEQGTSGIWTYRKWDSGIAECWGTSTFTNVPLTTAWGNCYYSSSVGRSISLPSSLFTSVTDISALVDSHGGLVTITGDGRSTSAFNFYLWSTKSETRSTVDVFASVKGTWK